MKKIAIIFGYNNTRLYDIERLKHLCKTLIDADIMLCKEEITEKDIAITPYTLAINMEIKSTNIIKQQIEEINHYIALHDLHPIACLPFSDKGIPLGTYYANNKGLCHDDCERSFSCIDKYTFRALEAEADTPAWYKKPFFTIVYSYADAEKIILEKNIPLFFKPSSEGNSRGCIEISTLEDLMHNKSILDRYFTQGIIIEECIQHCDEYSFDGVDGNYIITEKKTSQGYYRVETQHVLPAPLPEHYYNRLIEAGKIVAKLSGSLHGAVHHELFLNKRNGDVYCVEPNRRPAGLKLWDWVSIAYPGVDNWTQWIAWASGLKIPTTSPIKNQYHVGCRMLQATVNGVFTSVNTSELQKLLSQEDVIEINITKQPGSSVTSSLKDNSDFLGYVVCKSQSVDNLLSLLDRVEQNIMDALTLQ